MPVSYLQSKIDLELSRRALPGAVAYLLLLTAMATTTDFLHKPGTAPAMALLALLAVLRAVHIRAFPGTSRTVWKRNFEIGVYASAILWGGLSAYAFHVYGMQWQPLFMLLLTAGIGSGGSVSLAPDQRIARGFLLCLMVPPAISSTLFTWSVSPASC